MALGGAAALLLLTVSPLARGATHAGVGVDAPWPACQAARLPQALPEAVGVLPELVADLDAVVDDARAGGAVDAVALVVLRAGRVIYRRAWGRARPEAIFDLASLTKVVATLPLVRQLVAAGRLGFDDRLSLHLPWLRGRSLGALTVRELASHRGGLPSVLRFPRRGPGEAPRLRDERATLRERLQKASWSPRWRGRFRYSDLGYVLLGMLVEQLGGGRSLARLAHDRIFAPIGLCDTGFVVAGARLARVINPWPDGSYAGVVYDPMAVRLRGVAGHAGLYSTADDLARFAQAQLEAAAQGRMAAPAFELGWRAGLPYGGGRPGGAAPAGDLSVHQFGFTGTSLWIDPMTRTAVVLLSDRTRRAPPSSLVELRRRVHGVVKTALLQRPARAVRTGLDQLVDSGFAALRGLRIGLITNDAAIDARGRSAVQLLLGAKGVRLVAIFAAEHGLAVNREGPIADGHYSGAAGNRVPVHSLWGARRRLPAAVLKGLDALVFDLPTVGVRYYTYLTTLAGALEAAVRQRLRVFVLDRPNPLGGAAMDGPVAEEGAPSATHYLPLPVRYALTTGEVAMLFRAEGRIEVELTVVPVVGWSREWRHDAWGGPWRAPSPNLPSWRHALLYAATGLLEGTNLSVGRGTQSPFALLGAPWIEAGALARWLNARRLPGVAFVPRQFRPAVGEHRGRVCQGVRLLLTDLDAFRPTLTAVTLMAGLYRAHRGQWDSTRLSRMVRDAPTLAALLRGDDPVAIAAGWQPALERFARLRQRYLLYP
ncbi:MAG: DUF1343 domain-containing protein [Proteobacteria bacterium]|nr:DUF1343 domain-containing protein [Pseudomonadota bacterium]